jgi:hypothetical protein
MVDVDGSKRLIIDAFVGPIILNPMKNVDIAKAVLIVAIAIQYKNAG